MRGIEYALKRHPDTKALSVTGVRALLEYRQDCFLISYTVDAPSERLVLPEPAAPCQTDGLWNSTCFELFLHRAGPEYFEFNFSPSGQWGAYGFSGYRKGMRPLLLDEPPEIRARDEKNRYSLSVVLGLSGAVPVSFGISAILEEPAGAKSYWALSHPRGKPDFHHADCFMKFPQ